jgi:N-acetylglucosamine-6-phosphate deacetylase
MRRLGVSAAMVDGEVVPGDVGVEDGRVAAVGLPPGSGGLAVPGLVDLQVNGYAGVDFLSDEEDGWVRAAAAMARDGVTAYVANLITAEESVTLRALGAARRVSAEQRPSVARLLGAHLEGPFLSPVRAGTHPVEALRLPDVALTDRLLAGGPVVGMTVAPELPGAAGLIAHLVYRRVVVALGHSDATGPEAHEGFASGATAVTHVFNGMRESTAREPGLAVVALTRDDVAVQLICDGVHLSRDTVRLVVAAAPNRFVLVTDALAAAGGDGGLVRLAGMTITVVDGQARREDGTLAGSIITLAGALRLAVEAGARVEDAVAAATTRPAALLRRTDLGRLRPGDPADLAVLDEALEVTQTLMAGNVTPA